ncbi:hypothetical protein FVE85_3154 [Porphyridium purpureum]|uniref:Uncharacterized protein n=1 Tax=Porphyridium purpureum TaxID=35688 RepID=A0A5J4YW00_PORPP|nr:hypothetical protein FVE85_3154 [Porphyridium purpureum]|eukprot:POR6735..scf227_4
MVRVGGGRRDRRPFETRAALGISGGCYVGAGFGFAVGIGNLWMLPGKSDTAIVTPSLQLQPFAHQGYLVGAFCGVAIGSGFGASVAKGIGFAFELEALLALFRALVRGKFVSALNASARRPKRQVTSKLLISSSSSNHIRSRPAGFIASASVPRING